MGGFPFKKESLSGGFFLHLFGVKSWSAPPPHPPVVAAAHAAVAGPVAVADYQVAIPNAFQGCVTHRDKKSKSRRWGKEKRRGKKGKKRKKRKKRRGSRRAREAGGGRRAGGQEKEKKTSFDTKEKD